MAETADVVVVGGGVIGASIAFYLARRSFARVVLYERETLGAGSTGRSVASVDLLCQHPPTADLQVRSLRAFQRCHELFGDECAWVETGMAVFAGPEGVAGLQTMASVIGAAGGCIKLLSPAEFQALEPGWAGDGVAAVAWVPEGGYLDPALLTNTLANAARRLGVVVRQADPLLALSCEGGRVVGVETRSGAVAAGAVVIAAGPWLASLLRPYGLDLPLEPQRHEVALLACPPDAPLRVSFLDLVLMTYARPESGGLAVCGSLDPAAGYAAVEPDADCPAPGIDYGMWVWERLVARYPNLERGGLRQGWSGLVTMSPDGQPLLGRLPLEQLYCAGGFSGAGLKIAPAVGEALAGLVAGDAGWATALHPLRPTRFADGEPLKAECAWGMLS